MSDRTDLTEMEQLRLTVSRQSVLNNSIAEKADLECLHAKLSETEKQIVSLKDRFKQCQQMYTVYSDIAKTYLEISQGDYIGRIVEEERRRQKSEKARRQKGTK